MKTMISYELTEKLKSAGFPQEGDGKYRSVLKYISSAQGIETIIYCPTLSELIEQFSGQLFELTSVPTVEGWLCKGGEKYTVVVGSTSEEAVAKLWLEIKSYEDQD